MILKFSKAKRQAKLRRLHEVKSLQPYLIDRDVRIFDLISGHSCPFAKDCLAKVIVDDDGNRSILDGKDSLFRCYSATQEAAFTPTYNLRFGNFSLLRSLQKRKQSMAEAISAALPTKAGLVRVHSAGDFFSPAYFKAWLDVASLHPDVLFYGYTKSLPYWKRYKDYYDSLPNFLLTASEGGQHDHLIESEGFRSVKVVFSEAEAQTKGLEIDHDDSHAADPDLAGQDFALLLHGVQKKGSPAADALRQLKGKGSYSRR